MPFAIGTQAVGITEQPLEGILALSPLVYYIMDESSGDLVNSGSEGGDAVAANLTYSQTAIPERDGGTSISFNGTSSAAVRDGGVIGGVDPVFTAGCWVNLTGTGTYTLFQQKDGTSSGCGFNLYLSGGIAPTIQGRDQAGNVDFSLSGQSIVTVNDGIPIFISTTVDADFCYLYVNGLMAGVTPRLGGTWVSTPDIIIGRNESNAQWFAGKMSHIFILDQVLDQGDHYALYRQGMLLGPSPAGDLFSDPIILSPTTTPTTTGHTNVDAGVQSGEPAGQHNPETGSDGVYMTNRTLWFKYTTPALFTDAISFITDPTTDNVVELFKDTDGTLAGLEPIAFDYGVSNDGIIKSSLESETDYYFRVDSYADVEGSIDIEIYTYTPPANDNFADAITIDVSSGGNVAGTTVNATIEDPLETDNMSGDGSVWYKFQADATGSITLDTQLSSPADTALQVWEGTASTVVGDLDWGTPYDSDDDSGGSGASLITAMAVTAGNWYFVQVCDYDLGTAFTLRWSDIT